MAVLWTWAGFRVMLDAENRFARDPQPTIGAVKQAHMGFFNPVRQALTIHCKAVIHRDNFNFTRCVVLDRVVGAMMALVHFDGGSPQGQSQHLVAEANAEQRQS